MKESVSVRCTLSHQSRAIVLADDRPDRRGEGENDPERDRRHAVDDGGSGDRRLAEIGEHAQRVGRADRRRHVGHDRRKADRHDRAEVAARGVELRPRDEIVHADRAEPADGEQDQAREDRRPGRAIDAEPKAENEQRVEKSRRDPADSVTYIARRASPTARKIPENVMPTASGTLAGMLMAMNFEATSADSPCACKTVVRIQSRRHEHRDRRRGGEDRRDGERRRGKPPARAAGRQRQARARPWPRRRW